MISGLVDRQVFNMKTCLEALKVNKSLWVLFISLTFSCTKTPANPANLTVENDVKDIPYVLLISIDGYRWDYTDKYSPPFISTFKNKGVSLKSLRPSFPTKTFPNHLSIVTGRYPMNHGIVGNKFYNPELKSFYSIRDSEAVANNEFYHSLPIWGLAEKQGLKTAPYFWPGSASAIQGITPSYNQKYKHNTPHNKRLKTVEEWFKMPKEVRPHLVTLYFHDVDSAGHGHGPDSSKVRNAITKVDQSIEKLFNNLEKLNLPINIIITSDHGMAALDSDKAETILKTPDHKKLLAEFTIIGNGALIHLYKKKNVSISDTIVLLNSSADHFKCYTPPTTPKKLNYRNNASIGDIVCLANKGWSISANVPRVSKGGHGWSQYDGMDMHGIFYAQGPNFKKNLQIETQDNVNIYPLIAHILNLKIKHEIDGNLENMQALLNE
jgi:alkaline phosphatase D